MGRRRRNDTEQSNSSQFKTWKVGKYIRLSRDDGNSESESITNQRKILNEHIPDFFEDDYDIIDEYIDDGRTGNLDTKASHEIMEFFTKLNEEGATVIVVTHEEDIAQYTKRIVRFQDGQIISDTKVVKEG